MITIRPNAVAPLLLAAALTAGGAGGFATTALGGPADGNLSAETFLKLRQQIRPQPGESRWLEIPWLLDVHAARQKAAAEGKPLFVYSGGGATGIGPC